MSLVKLRYLGKSGIQVSPLGLGCWAIGGLWQWLDGPGGWGEVDDNESIRAIHAALDKGINFFDTAANYGTGHSESILGQALAGKRDKVVIATKFGFVVDEKGKKVSMFKSNREIVEDVRKSCEASLRRLNTDTIDLFQNHIWDQAVEPALEVMGELEKLVSEGKIRSFGWSTDDPQLAKAYVTAEHCAAIQHDLNVVVDNPEMLLLCQKHQVASVNRSPLARGALTGKYKKGHVFDKDDVRTDDYTEQAFFGPSLENLESIRDILTSGGRTLAQGALAWIWGRSEMTIPIPGFRTVAQVEENAKAMEFGPLDKSQMEEIDSILDR